MTTENSLFTIEEIFTSRMIGYYLLSLPTNPITEAKLGELVIQFGQGYSNAYGYTDYSVVTGSDVKLYRLFRNRDDSFSTIKPHCQIWYR